MQATELTTANRSYTLTKKAYLIFLLFFWAGRDCAALVHSERRSRDSNTRLLVEKPNFEPLQYRSPNEMNK